MYQKPELSESQVALPIGQLTALKDGLHLVQLPMLVLLGGFHFDEGSGEPPFANLLDLQLHRQIQRRDASADRLPALHLVCA